MAQIDVGKLSFSHKGNYDASTAYVLNDVVYYKNDPSLNIRNLVFNPLHVIKNGEVVF